MRLSKGINTINDVQDQMCPFAQRTIDNPDAHRHLKLGLRLLWEKSVCLRNTWRCVIIESIPLQEKNQNFLS